MGGVLPDGKEGCLKVRGGNCMVSTEEVGVGRWKEGGGRRSVGRWVGGVRKRRGREMGEDIHKVGF